MLVGVLSGYGVGLLLQPFTIWWLHSSRVVHLNTGVLQTGYSQHVTILEMLDKTTEKLTKHTMKLWRNVEIKFQRRPRTEGQDCEGREVELDTGNAVDLKEVGGEKVAKVVPVKGLDNTRSKAGEVVIDEDDVIEKILKQTSELPVIEEAPRLRHLRVNLAGRSAENHRGQSRKRGPVSEAHHQEGGPAGTDHLLGEAGRGGDNLEAGTSEAVKNLIYKLSLCNCA